MQSEYVTWPTYAGLMQQRGSEYVTRPTYPGLMQQRGKLQEHKLAPWQAPGTGAALLT